MTFAQLCKLAQSLGKVEEATSYGTPALKVSGQLLARLREDGDSLVIATTFEEREAMMADDPETYYITDHYRNYPWVLVRLSRVNAEAMRDLLGRAWKLAAGRKRPARARRRGA